MASTHRAPKQWCLTKNETVNSFENWKQNLLYTLSLDKNFAPFLIDGTKWEKKSKTSLFRGFANDGEEVADEQARRTREQKVSMLELMLGQIANYCPVISRNTIVKNSTSMDIIWQTIRLHYGFQSTGAHFIDFSSIALQPDERTEDLYQRLMAFVEDNLLHKDCGISHHGDNIDEDEEMTPTLENFVVLTWLRLIHTDLPKLVKQRYGTELRSRTLASIKPEISQALESLLEEIRSSEDAKVMRTAASSSFSRQKSKFVNEDSLKLSSRSSKCCPLCKEAGRPDKHFLSKCSYLPASDRKYMIKARQITGLLQNSDDDISDYESEAPKQSNVDSVAAHRVMVRQSPYLDTFYAHYNVRLTIDSGATGNMIRLSTVQRLGIPISKSSQSAHQADGSSPLKIMGEVHVSFTRDDFELHFEGLVVESLDVEVLAGIPFMEKNDVSTRPAKRQVSISDTIYRYGSHSSNGHHSVRRTHVLRAPGHATTVWPGDYLELQLPTDLNECDETYAIEPHLQTSDLSQDKPSATWPEPNFVTSVAGRIRIPNSTSEPVLVKRNDHIGHITRTVKPDFVEVDKVDVTFKSSVASNNKIYSDTVNLDPDNLLTPTMKAKFKETLLEFDSVFNPRFSGYNGAVGPFEAKVNMGPVLPPQRKGRVPQYSKNQLVELQHKFDELEDIGVFRRPEDIGQSVEYVNPSFLVKKSSGGFRLVTAFADVGRYSKPQPSLMPDIDSTLRQIAQWKYIIATDLTQSFYQIPLSEDSMKYCGVVTPFRGVRVYARSAMGMPGSETALEELMCRVLGDMVEDGTVAKIADDLYCGGNTPEELLCNWRRVLESLKNCSLNLSASKTVIAPRKVTILGWIWEQGTLRASPHRISTLSTCPLPTTVTGLRSFIGAYKVLARVVPNCASLLGPLGDAIAGCQSKDNIKWSDDLIQSFRKAQNALTSSRSITLPKPTDQLWIVTDGAAKKHGLGATLYISRHDKVLVAGFFSAKLRKRQFTWLPCEIEALSIAAAIKHFSPYIVQSNKNGCVLTDSKPCVQAFEKLCRGEFSASPRVSIFLSTASRYQVSVRHVAGASILPSDFASRNAPECEDNTCQICNFVHEMETTVVRSVSINDILKGTQKLPFTSRNAWLSIQSECPDLRRTHAHLVQGTRPSKKLTNVKDVKRYLNVASIAKDGLLVVKRTQPLGPTNESIIVPRQVLDGLLTSLHVKLSHPTYHQLKTVAHRYLFALDMDSAIQTVTNGCHHCASLKRIPNFRREQTSEDPPESVGLSFAADVIKRERQLILLVRECVTSFTCACIVDNERRETLRDALLRLCIELRPLDGPFAVIRTDAAPGLKSLVNDELLRRHRISIEVGNPKNVNKNPVAEKAVQELEFEILKLDPAARCVTPLSLTIAVAQLNSRIRNRGLSAREMWYSRDQFTNNQIPIVDREIIQVQHEKRVNNHSHSEKSKAPLGKRSDTPNISVGDLVYLLHDRNKTCARDRYLVVSVNHPWCNVRKFAGSQLRDNSYRVLICDVYKVPSVENSQPQQFDITRKQDEDDLFEVSNISDETATHAKPIDPPTIPDIISVPPTDDIDLNQSPEPMSTCDTVDSHVVTDDPQCVPQRPKRTIRLPKHLEKDYVLY